jgi:hypothetical protein
MTTVMPVVPVYDLWLKHVVIRRKSRKIIVLIKTSCVKGNAEFILCVCVCVCMRVRVHVRMCNYTCNYTQQNETC